MRAKGRAAACGIVVLIVVTSSAFATHQGPAPDHYTVFGVGNRSCGAWLEERRKDSILSYSYMHWLTGFLSGVGWKGDDVRTVDAAAMNAWIDNYCRTHPLENIAKAAQELAIELRR